MGMGRTIVFRKVVLLQKPDKIYRNTSGVSNYSKLLSKVLILLLILLIAACTNTNAVSHMPTPTSPAISPTREPVEQAAAPGSIEVKVTLVEFRIISSVTVFHANSHYYFVVSNHGHDLHEFMIMPSKPDGSPLPPD
jgi:hypothetical protein